VCSSDLHAYLNGSFAVRSLLNRLESIPAEKLKLSRSLGLSPWQRFKLVEWPALRSTIPGLSATIFLLCFTSFAIVLTLGGSPRYNTLEVAIYEAVKLDFDIPHALDLALLQLMVCAALVFFASGFRSTTAIIGSNSEKSAWPEPTGARIFQIAIIGFFAVCFLAPLLAITIDGIKADFLKLFAETGFRRALITSLSIASASAAITFALTVLIALSKRNLTLPGRLGARAFAPTTNRVMAFSTALYLAFPSLVLGLSFFLVARQLPGSLNFWALVAVLVANVLMAMPFAIAIMAPAMEKTAMRYDRLCLSLGLKPLARWQVAEWPLLKRDIGYVVAISFCLSLGDLGVIALFGNQDFATLPWYLYQKMGSYRTDDAAGVALVLLVIVLTVFLTVPRIIGGRQQRAISNAET